MWPVVSAALEGIMETVGTVLIVVGVIAGIALGCGIAFGIIPIFEDYKKRTPSVRKGTMSRGSRAARLRRGAGLPVPPTRSRGRRPRAHARTASRRRPEVDLPHSAASRNAAVRSGL